MTTGSSGGFLLAFLAAFEAGDRVAIARPGYACYRNVLKALGCEVVELPTGPESRFQPTVACWRSSTEPVQGLVVASPANPTGTMLDASELAALATWCEERGVRLISDEIYHGIEYHTEGQPPVRQSSAWETSREAVVFNSFSKYFSMTGWRIGWMLVPEQLRRPVDVLTGNFTICPPVLAQHAAIAAFTTRRTPSATATWRGTPRTVGCCSTGCRSSASTGSLLPTARSTCTPTSGTSPTTR